ncbi:MAG: S-adenosylmethionine:tRNA ribosyltransferase-isomerase [Actinomycetota bacterium]|jgi:S-adenosylmethionine:tRNA ribosyltransferase-isomerase|nr:S-adenosylmethionine:tRNA ribosyltransferase-isomerase [Actinomycetota bacterium]
MSRRDATAPPEARGLARDEVRLLAAGPGVLASHEFRCLPELLEPGDLVVVNTSATLPAAIDARRRDGRPVVVHFSTELADGDWVVEVRPPAPSYGPVPDMDAGDHLSLPTGARLTLVSPHTPRLWRAHVMTEGGVVQLLAHRGRPVTYAYVLEQWPLSAYQTVFARHPGSAEMPSAGRPFSDAVVTELVTRGIAIAPLKLHTGLSSAEDGEPPQPEWFQVPEGTARLVEHTRRTGGRVVAVGTTVTRALESVADVDGSIVAGEGWTDLVLGAERPARVVTGLVTGWHAPGASHLSLLEAVAGDELVRAAYDEAERAGFLWHEFGDSCLLLP